MQLDSRKSNDTSKCLNTFVCMIIKQYPKCAGDSPYIEYWDGSM